MKHKTTQPVAQARIKGKLKDIRSWAQESLQDKSHPPWAWYQYMKLVEAIDGVLGGMNTVNQTANLRQSVRLEGNVAHIEDSKSQPNTVQPHPSGKPIQLPM